MSRSLHALDTRAHARQLSMFSASSGIVSNLVVAMRYLLFLVCPSMLVTYSRFYLFGR